MKISDGSKKLLLIGLGAMFVYSQLGPIGLIIMAVVLMITSK